MFCFNKANMRDLIAATGLVIVLKLESNRRFSACMTIKFDGWPRKIIGHLFYTTSSFVHHLKSIGEFKLELQSRNAQIGSKSAIFPPVWPWNLMDDLASFQRHRRIRTWVSPETINSGSNRRILPHVILIFDRWPWKIKGHIFYFASSFVHHFIVISEYNLELQSENTQFCQNRCFFVPWDLEIWQMTLKKNRVPLLCCFTFCASLCSHWWIQTGISSEIPWERYLWPVVVRAS